MKKSNRKFSGPFLLLFALSLLAGFLSASPVTFQEGAPWKTEFGREHPLTGRIWDTARREFVTSAALIKQLTGRSIILLGEKHDNPDHHRLQAWVLRELVKAGRKPPVSFEMFDTSKTPIISKYRNDNPGDVDGIAEATNWKESGWPEWEMYRPIVAAAVEAGLPIIAANLSRETARALSREGTSALPAALVREFHLDQPPTEEVRASMDKEIREAHCGMANDSMVESMIRAQRARDAQLAERVLANDWGEGGVLITGNGHARTDRGVPTYLRMRYPQIKFASVGFLEVDDEKIRPDQYPEELHAGALPYDFVWFTPRVDNLDPCEKFRESLEKMKKQP